jgi:hypothetical protein
MKQTLSHKTILIWGFGFCHINCRGSGPFVPSIYFFLTGNIVCFGRPNSILHNQIPDRQATNRVQFFNTMKFPPPPNDCKIPISFQRRWLINSSIDNPQCMFYLIVHALTIANFCFFDSWHYYCTITATNIEIIDNDHIKILSLLILPSHPHHGNSAVLTPNQLPSHPFPPLHLCPTLVWTPSSAWEGRDTMMKAKTIREAMPMLMMSEPVCPTHNHQPWQAGGGGGSNKN